MSKIPVDSDILFYSLRYALKRVSNAPEVVMTNIYYNLKNLKKVDLKRMLKEINKYKDKGFISKSKLWITIARDIEEELDIRK